MNESEATVKKQKMEAVEVWEEKEFQELDTLGSKLEFIPESQENFFSVLQQETEELLLRFDSEFQEYDFKTEYERKSLLLIALYLDCGINWDYRSDVTATKILSTLFGENLRAHKEGIYHYKNGSWIKMKELPEIIISDMEKVFNHAQILYDSLAGGGIEKSWAAVFYFFKTSKQNSFEISIETSIASPHWAGNISKSLWNILARFTSTSKEEIILTNFGRWFESKKPDPNGIINFTDLSVSIIDEENNNSKLVKQIQKSPKNNCYFNIPISISTKVSDSARDRLRLFLSTIYAGNPDSRRINMALESLVWYGYEMPQKMVILKGNGGDGKSALGCLRNAVFSNTHQYISPSIFQVREEFRIQGISFSSARFLTVQECNSGSLLQESIFKTFVAGEKLPCRPNYGKSTDYFSWEYCAKVWEMNNCTPRINGNSDDVSSLKSWTRRLIVCNMESSFSSNSSETDIQNRVFSEDTNLRKFLQSEECKLAYIKHQLIPFISKNSPKSCLDILSNPPDKIQLATLNFVKQMADGGIKAESSNNDIENELTVQKILPQDFELSATLESLHQNFYPHTMLLKSYKVRAMNEIGSSKGGKGCPGRVQTLKKEIEKYPFVLKYFINTDGFRLINIDWNKFKSNMKKI